MENRHAALEEAQHGELDRTLFAQRFVQSVFDAVCRRQAAAHYQAVCHHIARLKAPDEAVVDALNVALPAPVLSLVAVPEAPVVVLAPPAPSAREALLCKHLARALERRGVQVPALYSQLVSPACLAQRNVPP